MKPSVSRWETQGRDLPFRDELKSAVLMRLAQLGTLRGNLWLIKGQIIPGGADVPEF
jgi:hypothetical protein